ncbi:MAG: type II CAAX endopeptidase family protein [Thermoanaerobaculia bacterium]
MEILRTAGPATAALAAALLFDHMTRRRGLDPPGFREPTRRFAAMSLVAFCFYVGIFAALATIGRQAEVDLTQLRTWQLFTLHGLFVLTILGWWATGFALATRPRPPLPASGLEGELSAATEPPPRPPGKLRSFAEQLGFRTPHLGREIGVGLIAGVGAWLAVLCGVLVFALILQAVSGEELLPQTPPAVIPWLAAQPILLRLAIAASAGLVEETFFRGLLQPRIGIALSTLFFALAHLSYGQPILLVGVTLLSLLYGGLTRWRQNIWPAVVAHFLFDGVQLLVVIPSVLDLFHPAAPLHP